MENIKKIGIGFGCFIVSIGISYCLFKFLMQIDNPASCFISIYIGLLVALIHAMD